MSYLDSELVVYPTVDQEHLYTIYKATNTVNGKVYIGFDSNWPDRKRDHLWFAFAENYSSYNSAFYRAIRKYGKDVFTWEILYQYQNKHFMLYVMESFLIEKHRSYIHHPNTNGYNMTLGGEGNFGMKKTEETKQKLRIANTGKIRSDEQKKNMSISRQALFDNGLIKKANQEKYLYTILDVNNVLLTCTNLRKFCREHNLSFWSMHNTYKKYAKYRGFQIISKTPLIKAANTL